MPQPSRPTRRLLLAAAAAPPLLAAGRAEAWFWQRGLPDPADPRTTLDAVEAAVARLLPLPELTTAQLAERLGRGDAIVLLDVREPAEYAQSRIPGARRVDPGATSATLLAEHGAHMAGATVVLTCAVGWRSGVLLSRIRDAATAARAAALFNLRGGIFRWHAEGRPLEPAGAGVHHYDAGWGRLLRRTLGG